ncbi:hypothetical protein VV02_03340 [Luteipulveratus mongoliensis]|uniref:Ribbon-helix-helix protein CopG domain-containing protein n=2 Tax=Luteipulveratus mongoliensis TaxID=571913 RepID=A0A0K1JEU5_9MICO|nr:hypothetical protein VV02_03340 [Luteipulveratus mongoliensis]
MERRLQLLLDRERYARVEEEAERSGRSVAAVIREAIDWRFNDDKTTRQRAAADLLGGTTAVLGTEPDWAETKSVMDADLERTI